jgi:hypothetical protein
MARETAYYDDQSKGGGGSSKLFKTLENNAGPALLAGSGAAGYADYKLSKQREQDKSEAASEMKRESRGIPKPANFDAIEEAKRDAQDAKDRKKISDMGYAKGGKVSSASKRGDGIATKGKTRGTMITMKGGGCAY